MQDSRRQVLRYVAYLLLLLLFLLLLLLHATRIICAAPHDRRSLQLLRAPYCECCARLAQSCAAGRAKIHFTGWAKAFDHWVEDGADTVRPLTVQNQATSTVTATATVVAIAASDAADGPAKEESTRYCVCRGTDAAMPMIACDSCDEWYVGCDASCKICALDRCLVLCLGPLLPFLVILSKQT